MARIKANRLPLYVTLDSIFKLAYLPLNIKFNFIYFGLQ